MSVPPSQGFLQGLRNTRQAQGDGTLQGRVRSAMPASPRPVGGRQEAITKSAGPSVRVDTLTLTADSQPIADTSDDIVWDNELVGLTPREGFGGYGTPPTDTIVIPVDGRLLASCYLNRSTTSVWTVVYHVTREAQTFTYTVPGPTSGGSHLVDPPHLTVKAGDVLRVRILQSSGGAETLNSATLHLTLVNTSPRSEPPEITCVIVGTPTAMFQTPSSSPWGLAWSDTGLWHSDAFNDTIYRLDPADGTVLQSFAAPASFPRGLAWDGTDLWHADEGTDTIYRLDPANGTVLQSFVSPSTSPTGLAWDGTDLWAADQSSATIYRLDPADGTVLQSFAAPASFPQGLAWDGTDLWTVDDGSYTIYRLDPANGTVLQQFSASIDGSGFSNSTGLTWDTAHGCRLWIADDSTTDTPFYTFE